MTDTFFTEKQIEEALIEEVRTVRIPNGKQTRVRMPKVHWNALEWLTTPPMNGSLEEIIANTQKWADKFGYSFEDYFSTYITWFYKGVVSD